MKSSSHTPLFVLRTSHFVPVTGQPRGQQLEYRLIAVNLAGESTPSNTVPVVL